jgi:hypothetical protein
LLGDYRFTTTGSATSMNILKPNPTELEAAINPETSGKRQGVESHRKLFCRHYDDCLDEAVMKGWNSWTCTRCPLYRLSPEVEGGLEGYATQRRSV